MSLLYPLENIRTRLQVQVQRRTEVDSSPEAHKPVHTCRTVAPSAAEPASADATDAETTCALTQATTTDSTSEKEGVKTYFPLHAPRMVPLAPPCLACIFESGASSTSHPSSGTRTAIASPSTPQEYEFTGSIDVVRQVCAREGWRQLYSGLESALIGVGASSAVYFFWYYTFKSVVLAQTGARAMGPLSNLGVASVAGVVNVMMTLPIWLVNTRITVASHGEYTGVWDAIKKIHGEEGLRGFYRGLAPSLILVSNPAIQFVVYEQMIALWTRSVQQAAAQAGSAAAAPARLSSLQYFVLGAFAKAVATVATFPYQVVKARMQASRTPHQSTWAMVQTMWREEGIRSFYGGMNAKMSQTVLNSAFMSDASRARQEGAKHLCWMCDRRTGC